MVVIITSTTASVPTTSPTISPDPAREPATNLVDIHFGILVATHTVALLLTTTFVGLRLYVRRAIVRDLALDDWMLLAAQISYVIYIAFMLGYGINVQIYGLQKVFWETLKIASIWEVPLVITMVLVRAAIATFFLRVLPAVDNKITRLIITAIFWFYAGFMIAFMFLNVFQCGDPLKKRYGYSPVCVSAAIENNLPIVVRIVTMCLDWIVTLLPISVIFQSTLSRQAKLSVAALMLLAGTGSTVSVLSIVYNDLGLWNGPKSFGDFTLYSLFSLLENGLAIIVLSLAALRPLFQRCIKDSSSAGSSRRSTWISPAPNVNSRMAGAADDDDGAILLSKFETDHQYQSPRRPNVAHGRR